MASMNYFLSKLYISGITLSAMQKVKRLEKQIMLKFLGSKENKEDCQYCQHDISFLRNKYSMLVFFVRKKYCNIISIGRNIM